jgi:hypothetical protein
MSLSKEDIKKIVDSSYLEANHKFEYPPVCLEISGEYGKQIFATLGNFSTILAPPKVGKTTLTGVIAGVLLTGNQISNFISSLPENKRVVAWADTEQGKPECIKTIQSICIQTTGNKTEHPKNLKFLSLRKYGKDIRLDVIEYIVYNTPNIGFLVIDGVRDLVSSINNEVEATIIADKLLKWSEEANIHILTILHQNKGDANARGHLGTELMNKAETVASLSRGDNNGTRTTIIEPKFTRHKEFESFAFTIDYDGNVSEAEIKTTYEPQNPKVNQLTYQQILDLFRSVFDKNKRLTYKPVCDSIQLNLNNVLKIKFGIDKTKKLVKWLKDENYLHYEEETKTYFANMPL